MPTAPLETPEKTDAEKAEGEKPIAAKSPLANFITDSLGIKPKAEKKPAPKADDEPEGDEPPEPKPKKKAAPSIPVPAAIDEEKLGRSIAAGLAPHLKAGAPADEKKEEPAVDPKEKRRLDVLLHMEQMPEFSERYKGLAERFKANKTKLRDYAKKWETENPGAKFSEDDAEHSTFLDKLEKEVEYDDDDFHEAIADLRVARKLEETKGALDSRVSEIERRERATQEAPKAATVAAESGNAFWQEFGDEFKGVVTERGGINMQAIEELRTADPVQAEVLEHSAQMAEAFAHRIFLLGNNLAAPVSDKFHGALSEFAVEQEQLMLKRPRDKQLDGDGKQFATKAQWQAMSEAERARHWVFSTDDLLYRVPRHFAKKAKETLAKEEEKFVARARARRLLPADETPSKAKRNGRLSEDATDDEDDELKAEHTRKPLSPTSVTSPKSAVLKGLGGAGAKSGLDRWVQESIG